MHCLCLWEQTFCLSWQSAQLPSSSMSLVSIENSLQPHSEPTHCKLPLCTHAYSQATQYRKGPIERVSPLLSHACICVPCHTLLGDRAVHLELGTTWKRLSHMLSGFQRGLTRQRFDFALILCNQNVEVCAQMLCLYGWTSADDSLVRLSFPPFIYVPNSATFGHWKKKKRTLWVNSVCIALSKAQMSVCFQLKIEIGAAIFAIANTKGVENCIVRSMAQSKPDT